jgi:CheY-like chemotaxis protein
MAAAQKVSMNPKEKLRALVVDDSHDSAQTMVWALEALGYEGAIAHDGASALEVGRPFRPHAVLLDINLPGMNGYEVCQAMHNDPAFQNTIFIAQTGWSQKEHQLRAQAAGFDHHLVKPIQLNDLQKIFDALLRQGPASPKE